VKSFSLYKTGLRPAIFSEKSQKNKGIGWQRLGVNIAYKKNNIIRNTKLKKKYFYTLSFEFEFEYADDIVYIAYSYPYTFSKLNEFLNTLVHDKTKSVYLTKKVYGHTLAKNK